MEEINEAEITKAEFSKLKEEILRGERIRNYKRAVAWIFAGLLSIGLLYYFS